MKRSILLAAATAAIAFGAIPAAAMSAITVVGPATCINVADANGCLFNGNMGNQTDAQETEDAYNLFNNTNPSADPDITLNFFAQTGDDFAGAGQTSGTWSNNFFSEFLAVKAGDFFVLYKLAAPAKSGTWNTFDIPLNTNGQPRGLSHLAFLGSDGFDPGGGAVPEPATWAMLLSGFGLVGFAARRRRGAPSVAA
jgi:hypothetical protein